VEPRQPGRQCGGLLRRGHDEELGRFHAVLVEKARQVTHLVRRQSGDHFVVPNLFVATCHVKIVIHVEVQRQFLRRAEPNE
jgi:hypothetical protein